MTGAVGAPKVLTSLAMKSMVLGESAPRRAPQAHTKLAWAVIRAIRAPQAQGRGS
jgi:hypothetical protein